MQYDLKTDDPKKSLKCITYEYKAIWEVIVFIIKYYYYYYYHPFFILKSEFCIQNNPSLDLDFMRTTLMLSFCLSDLKFRNKMISKSKDCDWLLSLLYKCFLEMIILLCSPALTARILIIKVCLIRRCHHYYQIECNKFNTRKLLVVRNFKRDFLLTALSVCFMRVL